MVKFLLAPGFPAIAWWREIYDMPFTLWEQLDRIADQRLGR